MTKAEKIQYYENRISALNTAIEAIEQAGQSYEITSGAGAGTKRVVTMPEYTSLVAERDKFEASLAALKSARSLRLTAGW
jgi:hypothetical protein